MIYVAESDKTEASDFFKKNDQFKCWMSHAGKKENLYLSIYPMWESSQPERNQLVKKIITRYNCNEVNEDSQNTPTTTAQTIEPEPEPEPEQD